MKNLYYVLAGVLMCFYAHAQLPQLQLVPIASGYTSPIDIKNCGDDRIFILEQRGVIWIMDKNGVKRDTPFLDISYEVNSAGNEQGLLSIAFSPNYKTDSTFYVNFITGPGNGNTVIARFHASADSNYADTGTQKNLLEFAQPFSNHNGSTLMFGPDGYLYDTQGDGGDAGDPYGNGQNKDTYLAKILRFDVSNQDTTYLIPPTNPFADSVNLKPEIWAYGMRNPWRASFDRLTGDMWIGDVGQNLWEEIDFQPAGSAGGQDYGWNCYEGDNIYNANCGVDTGFTWPVFEYIHSTTNGCCVIGGYVYRGAQFSSLFGRYICTDLCSGRFLSIMHPDSGVFITDTLQSFPGTQFTTFGQDNNGRLYLANRTGGIIYRVTDTSNCLPVAYILPDSLQNCTGVTLTALYDDSLSYEWYNSNGPIGVASNQLVATASGWYKVMVSKSQPGCRAFSDSVLVTILTDTLVPCNCTQTLCINDAPLSLAARFTPFGGVYSGAGISGDTLLNPLAAGAGPDTIRYVYANNYGCVSTDSLVFQINVNTPLTDTASKFLYCAADTPFNLYGYIIPAGGTYSGVGVISNFFNPLAANPRDTVYYIFLDTLGCTSTDSLIFRVNSNPVLLDSVPVTSVCSGDTPINLTGFIRPAGGIYQGIGISDNTLNPALANTYDTIYYTYTNTAGCIASDTFTLIVSNCTGIKSPKANFALNIYPNPNDGCFNIEIKANAPEKLKLEIADETGRICYIRELQAFNAAQILQLSVSGLSRGAYLLRLAGNSGYLEKKLLIE